MSSCQCCPDLHAKLDQGHKRTDFRIQRFSLFNWVTVLLVTGWVGIVSVAFHLAGPSQMSAVPTLEAFLRTLL